MKWALWHNFERFGKRYKYLEGCNYVIHWNKFYWFWRYDLDNVTGKELQDFQRDTT